MKYDELDYKDREYMYIPRKLAKAIKDAESEDSVSAIVAEYIEQRGVNIEYEMARMEEDTLKFRHMGASYKNTLSKIANDQIESLETIWEKMDDTNTKIKKQYEKISSVFSSIEKTQKQIKDVSDRLDTHTIDRVERVYGFIKNMTQDDIDTLRDFADRNSKVES